MQAATFYRLVTVDEANLLDRLLELLRDSRIPFCVIGGQAVNAYVEPVVSLDLDLVIATDDLDRGTALLERVFRVERFQHSINVSAPKSDLRVQIQTDPRYMDFMKRVTDREVLGRALPVAHVEDVLLGKVWAAQDPTQRPSKRQKDLADIARLVEGYPALRDLVPADLLARLV